jgi:apolipoprotein N-acyltransferase
VLDRSDTGTSEVLVERLPLAAGVPLGVRAGATLEWTLALAGLAAAATALVRGRRRVAWAAGGGA